MKLGRVLSSIAAIAIANVPHALAPDGACVRPRSRWWRMARCSARSAGHLRLRRSSSSTRRRAIALLLERATPAQRSAIEGRLARMSIPGLSRGARAYMNHHVIAGLVKELRPADALQVDASTRRLPSGTRR